MRHHTLIVCTDPRIEPELLTSALDGALARAPRGAIPVVRVVLAAVLPPTLPISAWPAPPAERLEGLRAAPDERGRTLAPCPRVEIAPCRSIPALLDASWPVDALVLVGSAGWGVRRAARRVAPDVTILPSRRGRRHRQPGRAQLHEAFPR
jgi:hypothetical protein